MADDIGNALLVIFGAIITLAIVSVLVGQKSSAPAGIAAAGNALATVVAAAVAPSGNAANNGNLGANVFTSSGLAGQTHV